MSALFIPLSIAFKSGISVSVGLVGGRIGGQIVH
jgi:hypothetical protein